MPAMEPARHPDTCGASLDAGGLLDAEEDLRIFWLALRTEGHASIVHSVLLREASSTSSYALPPAPSLFANTNLLQNPNPTGPRVVYVQNLNLPWAAQLKDYVKKHLGIVLVAVNDKSCPLRAKEIFDILARPCYGARWNQLVRSFYADLSPRCARLNAAVLAATSARDALPRIANLARLAYLNRLLAALRRRVSELKTRRDTLRNANTGSPSFKCTTTPTSISPPRPPHNPSSNASTPRTPGPTTPHASRFRRHCIVAAEPVRSNGRTGSASSSASNPREYIVGGICVPSHLLNAVESSLVRDYRLYIQVPQSAHPRYAAHFAHGSLASLANHGTALLDLPPVCNVISPLLEPLPPAITLPPLTPSGSSHMFSNGTASTPSPGHMSPPLTIPPPPLLLGAPRVIPPVGTTRGSPRHLREHRSVDEYLRNCFGVGWTSVCNAAIRNAKRQQRERQLGEICAALARTEDALSTGNEQRKRLVDKAIQFDMAGSGLAGYCALALVQQIGDDETQLNNMQKTLPFAVKLAVQTARKSLKRLTDDNAVSLEAYH